MRRANDDTRSLGCWPRSVPGGRVLGQLRETISAHMTTDPSRVGAVALRANRPNAVSDLQFVRSLAPEHTSEFTELLTSDAPTERKMR